ncbi:AGE family epimerase/isomerase [Carboxylicivirga sp. RSCT41]|uniref:AGE family epimerase/isomerase n=1 Tax=Carboxylicivirga agarovorans TaxID=3417570 RepID=UPI003D35324E
MQYTLLLLSLFILVSCQQASNNADAQFYATSMEQSIHFFDKAYNADQGFYYSEVNHLGQIESDRVHTVALSRMIYGLAYAAAVNAEFAVRAEKAAAFQLKHMIAEDKDGLYYKPAIGEGEQAEQKVFDIWQQAYGACGLTELYRHTGDEMLLHQIHRLNNAFIKRFQDKANGGFYGLYDAEEGQVSGSKTIQSLMYPITALMGNLWLADIGNREQYETIIKEHLAIAYKSVWNDSLQWVNTRFDDNWQPVYADGDMVSPGHNFQFAALMLRSANWSFLSDQERSDYHKLGKTIVKATLEKNIWAGQEVSQGFFEAINPHTGEVLYRNKSWWQHCEALIALSFIKDEFADEYQQLKDFYFGTFIDTEHGGEWAKVDEDNQPLVEPKGQKGKSVYHHIEMLRFLSEAEQKTSH